MAALQGIRRRIRSVSSTRQITKAMQLVAASKLRRAQDTAMRPQAYTAAARELLERLGANADAAHHPLFQQRPVKRALTITIAGDRGMAGAYNSNIFKLLWTHLKDFGVPQSIIAIGRQAATHMARTHAVNELAAYDLEVANTDVEVAQPVLEEAIELFLSGQIDAVHIISTRFISTVRQEATVTQLLPVEPPSGRGVDSELEPNPESLLDFATRRLLEAQLLQAIYEARASEQAARMLAMMNATDNAKELIDDLTLAYNNARQASITQEISEISAGAEAISD